MRDTPVKDIRPAHAPPDGLHAAVHLGNHASADNALVLQLRHVADIDKRDDGAFVVLIAQKAPDIRHQNQFFRAHFGGDARRGNVRVDVVDFPVFAARYRRDNRHIAVCRGAGNNFRIHFGNLADKAKVFLRRELFRLDHAAVQAAKADCPAVMPFQKLNQVLVDLSCQHHLYYIDGFAVGHAQPPDEPAFLADLFEHPADFRATAVYKHHVDAHKLHQNDVAHDRVL